MTRRIALLSLTLLLAGCNTTGTTGGDAASGGGGAQSTPTGYMARKDTRVTGWDMRQVLSCMGQPARAVQSGKLVFWIYQAPDDTRCRVDVVFGEDQRAIQGTYMLPAGTDERHRQGCERLMARCGGR